MQLAPLIVLTFIFASLAEVQGDCEPGKSFKQDCNTCFCSADGKNAACTLKACLPEGQRYTKRHIRDTLGSVRCTPGRPYKLDCNTCTCTPDGRIGGCTYKLCYKQN